MEILQVLGTGRARSISVEDDVAVDVHVFNENYYHYADSFLRNDQIGDMYIPQRDVGMSQVVFCPHHSTCKILIIPKPQYLPPFILA